MGVGSGMYDILNHFYLDIEIEQYLLVKTIWQNETFKGNGDQTSDSCSF